MRPSGLGSPSELSLLPLVETRPPLVGFVRRCGHPRSRLAPRPDVPGAVSPSTDPAPRRRCQRRDPGDCHRASTPARIAARFGPGEPSPGSCSVLVVSHHLDGFLRSEDAGLLHPAAGHGVRCVSGSRIPGSAAVLWPEPVPQAGGPTSSPQRISHPPKESSPAAAPRHRGRCPRAVRDDPARPETTHRCQYTAASSARPPRRLRGVAPPSSSDDPRPLPVESTPCPSMGFVPLQGPSRTPASERGLCRATRPCPFRVEGRRVRRMTACRHRSVPHRRSDLSLPARPTTLAGEGRGGGPSARSEDRDRGRLGPTHRRPESRRRARRRRPAVASSRRLTSGSRFPCTRHERGRIPEAVGIPSAVHRGAGGSPILPSLTEARIRGAAAADRSALARRPTVSDEPVPKKSVQS